MGKQKSYDIKEYSIETHGVYRLVSPPNKRLERREEEGELIMGLERKRDEEVITRG